MKTRTKVFAKYFGFGVLILLITSILGCVFNRYEEAHLLKGWTFKQFECNRQGNIINHFDQAIFDDCDSYMKQKNVSFLYGVLQGLYEDGKGQYAVEFDAITNGKRDCWHYFLFYDKNGKRINVKKYYLGILAVNEFSKC